MESNMPDLSDSRELRALRTTSGNAQLLSKEFTLSSDLQVSSKKDSLSCVCGLSGTCLACRQKRTSSATKKFPVLGRLDGGGGIRKHYLKSEAPLDLSSQKNIARLVYETPSHTSLPASPYELTQPVPILRSQHDDILPLSYDEQISRPETPNSKQDTSKFTMTRLQQYLNRGECKVGEDGLGIWCVNLEKAYDLAVQAMPKIGKRKIFMEQLNDRIWGTEGRAVFKYNQCGINEGIIRIIYILTGEIRDRKQIMSHKQTLKKMRNPKNKDNANSVPEVETNDDEWIPAKQRQPSEPEDVTAHVLSPDTYSGSAAGGPTLQASDYQFLLPGCRTSASSSLNLCQRIEYQMLVHGANDIHEDDSVVHIYTRMQSETSLATLEYEQISEFLNEQTFPELHAHLPAVEHGECELILVQSTIQPMDVTTNGGIKLGIHHNVDITVPSDLHNASWKVRTTLRNRPGGVPISSFKKVQSEPLGENQVRLKSMTNDNEAVLWVRTLHEIMRGTQQTKDLSMTQELFAGPRSTITASDTARMIFVWMFSAPKINPVNGVQSAPITTWMKVTKTGIVKLRRDNEDWGQIPFAPGSLAHNEVCGCHQRKAEREREAQMQELGLPYSHLAEYTGQDRSMAPMNTDHQPIEVTPSAVLGSNAPPDGMVLQGQEHGDMWLHNDGEFAQSPTKRDSTASTSTRGLTTRSGTEHSEVHNYNIPSYARAFPTTQLEYADDFYPFVSGVNYTTDMPYIPDDRQLGLNQLTQLDSAIHPALKSRSEFDTAVLPPTYQPLLPGTRPRYSFSPVKKEDTIKDSQLDQLADIASQEHARLLQALSQPQPHSHSQSQTSDSYDRRIETGSDIRTTEVEVKGFPGFLGSQFEGLHPPHSALSAQTSTASALSSANSASQWSFGESFDSGQVSPWLIGQGVSVEGKKIDI